MQGMPGMNNMNNMQGMPGMNNMNNMQGMPGMNQNMGMNGMPGMNPNMQGMGMPGMNPNMQGMGNMNNMQGMPGMNPNMQGMNNMQGMAGMNQNMGMNGMPGMNPFHMQGGMGNMYGMGMPGMNPYNMQGGGNMYGMGMHGGRKKKKNKKKNESSSEDSSENSSENSTERTRRSKKRRNDSSEDSSTNNRRKKKRAKRRKNGSSEDSTGKKKKRAKRTNTPKRNVINPEIEKLQKELAMLQATGEGTHVQNAEISEYRKLLEGNTDIEEAIRREESEVRKIQEKLGGNSARSNVFSAAKRKEQENRQKMSQHEKKIGQKREEVKNNQKLLMKTQRGIDVLFVMDCTSSMGAWIDQAKTKISLIAPKFKEGDFQQSIIRYGFVAYRDFGDDNRLETLDFTEDVNEVMAFVRTLEEDGGGDTAEDVAGALFAATKLNWKSSTKLIIHFADAPAHGRLYNTFNDYNVPIQRDAADENMVDFTRLGFSDHYPDGDPQIDLDEVVKKLAKTVDYYFAQLDECTEKMTERFEQLYEDEGRRIFSVLKIGDNVNEFVPQIIRSMAQSSVSNVHQPVQDLQF
eukprot:TRINITY_DN1125_c0_g1_i2.p1 TRINITY_DN1125_c0_g1~~TRINITY_DN1125_c0_g1_i2.p1  ORF type:complete len:574 (+),score=162.78 TRINITY_DN1125_c0_g1_i2:274-1995(+)